MRDEFACMVSVHIGLGYFIHNLPPEEVGTQNTLARLQTLNIILLLYSHGIDLTVNCNVLQKHPFCRPIQAICGIHRKCPLGSFGASPQLHSLWCYFLYTDS